MLKLQNRIELLVKLADYLKENTAEWQSAKQEAYLHNNWFINSFIDTAVQNIVDNFLDKKKLDSWIAHYHLNDSIVAKNVGIVMAGNIPLVGFHDFLSVFVSGHSQTIKLSGKDEILMKHVIKKMVGWDEKFQQHVSIAPMLKNCDAYIATGSNNSASYFDFYFSKYPNIIRRNRTSVAIVTGNESADELEKLADDISVYFGLGCRNVTKIFVPDGYDFVPFLHSFQKYDWLRDHDKYKNNFDYNLTIQIMNNRFYMTNDNILLVESDNNFSPISQLNYSFYTNREKLLASLSSNNEIQCIVGADISIGHAQTPQLMGYADGVDTLQFLLTL